MPSTFKTIIMKPFGFLLLLLSLFYSCSPSIQKWYCTSEDIQMGIDELSDIPTSYGTNAPKNGEGRVCCRDKMNYIPDTAHLDHTPMRYIKLNVHLMNSSDSTQIWDEKKSRKDVKSLLWEAEKSVCLCSRA